MLSHVYILQYREKLRRDAAKSGGGGGGGDGGTGGEEGEAPAKKPKLIKSYGESKESFQIGCKCNVKRNCN